MKKYNNIKVLSCDIDGTLVGKDHLITRNTVETIDKVMEAGYLFGIASGRPVNDIKDYVQKWNMKTEPDFIIGFNGCQLWDKQTDQMDQYNMLSSSQLKEIIEMMEQFDANVKHV